MDNRQRVNTVSFDKGFECHEGCGISPSGQWRDSPADAGGESANQPLPKEWPGRGKEHGAPVGRTAPLPGLACCGRTGEPSVSQLRFFPAGASQGPGPWGCAGAFGSTDKTQNKKTRFPHPVPPFVFFPSALSLPLLKVNVVPLAFSAIFFTLKISTSRRPPEPLVALKIIIIING